MKLIVNGAQTVLDAATLADALALWLEEDARLEAAGPRVVATALNGRFVPAARRAAALLSEGDRIEILAPMQGG